MVSFRQLYEEGLKENVNFFDLDMEKVNQVDKIKNLETKLTNEYKQVSYELELLYKLCQKQSQKFPPQELVKIARFLNMDLKQDIKDVYFAYLNLLFRGLQSQQTNVNEIRKKKRKFGIVSQLPGIINNK